MSETREAQTPREAALRMRLAETVSAWYEEAAADSALRPGERRMLRACAVEIVELLAGQRDDLIDRRHEERRKARMSRFFHEAYKKATTP